MERHRNKDYREVAEKKYQNRLRSSRGDEIPLTLENKDMQTDELDLLAERFALERGGRSARLAKQFIDGLLAR